MVNFPGHLGNPYIEVPLNVSTFVHRYSPTSAGTGACTSNERVLDRWDCYMVRETNERAVRMYYMRSIERLPHSKIEISGTDRAIGQS